MKKQIKTKKISRRQRLNGLFNIVLVFFVAVIVYLNSLNNGFTFDDHDMIEKNVLIRSLDLNNIKEIFTTSWWWGGARQQSHEYRPLTIFSFAVYYQLAGLRPWFYHLINILLNAGVSVLLFVILSQMTGHTILPLVISLLYAVHPIHTEAVNNIVGEAELLSAIFFLLSFWLFMQGRIFSERPRWLMLLLSYGIYLAGLLSKESAITLPLILGIFHLFIYLNSCIEKPKIKQKTTFFNFLVNQWQYYIGFCVALILYFILRFNALGGLVSPTMGISYLDNVLEKARLEGNYLSLYLTALKIVGLYLWLLIFPLKLSADYSYDAVPLVTGIFNPVVWVTLITIGVAVYYAHKNYSRGQWLPLFGLLFFFISFAPVSNFFKLIGTTMAERLMYLPSIGFCIFLVFFIWQITHGRELLFYSLSGIIFIFFASRTFVRNFDWRDDFTLYKATVRATPRCSRAHFNLANHYKKQGKLDEALHHYKLSWEIAPNYGAPLVGVGEILFQQGKFQEAEEVFRQVIRMEDRYYPAHHNLAMVLEKLGKYEEAVAEYKRTIELRPTEPGPYFNLGLLYLDLDNPTSAKEYFLLALKLQPELYGNLLKIAEQYGREKKWNKAIALLESGIAATPQEFGGYLYLGKVYAVLGNKESALANLKQALALNPQNSDVHYELARVYLVLVKDESLAYQHFQQVLNLNPQHPDREKISNIMNQLADKLKIKR